MEFDKNTRLVIVTNVLDEGAMININEVRYRSDIDEISKRLLDNHSENANERDWLFKKFPETPIKIYKKPTDIPLEGYEASAYLKFFYDHYDNLPESMLCLHGHETDWHQQKHVYFNMIRDMNIKDSYLNISDIYINDRLLGKNFVMNCLSNLWDEYFRPYFNTDCPQYLSHFCCAQFLVKRDAVLLRPREAYKRWYELSVTGEQNKMVAQVFEYMWHAIFGEPYSVDYTEIKKKGDNLKREYLYTLKPKITPVVMVNGG